MAGETTQGSGSAPNGTIAAAPATTTNATAPAKPEATLLGGEQKPADTKPADAKATDGKSTDAKPTDAAPAEVELKLPEGFDPKDPLLGEFKPLAKELGLKSEQAQKLFDLHAKTMAAAEQQRSEQYAADQKAWVEAVKKDPDIGGPKLEASIKAAKQAVLRFGGPELAKFLDATGLGNHPELVKAFAKAGLALGEDSIAGLKGNDGPAKPANPLQAIADGLYTHPTSRAS